ncbi:CsgG/HfaB family protein [Desulfamplus magnetovallimortis]|uniref:CsgG/HfaB family protein n=1 Tax=Desulfamplus magnetovallimortis TaxID=1246637 RepID=UPI001644CA00|nr:CsgG/HfaB family protein [Desulfamplus magnetovallimortis]
MKKKQNRIKTVIACTLFFLFPFLMFCAPVQDKGKLKDGKLYGVTEGLFRGKWWNYYERALSFAEGDFLEDAERDLRVALNQRDPDQRRARTYGMHFVDYFPHRELGIVLLSMGRVSEAIDELETSLAAEDSAKAKFYLNRARKMLLMSQSGPGDVIPPEINITSLFSSSSSLSSSEPTLPSSAPSMSSSSAKVASDRLLSSSSVLTNNFVIDISGAITDQNYVYCVTVNNTPQFMELAEKKIRFEQRVNLVPGKNSIIIEAEDLMGNKTRKTIDVIADDVGPQISVLNYMNGQKVDQSSVELTISYYDDSGVDYLVINDDRLTSENRKNGILSKVVSLQPGKNTISMEALDRAGNRTRGQIDLFYGSSESKAASLNSAGDVYLALNDDYLLFNGYTSLNDDYLLFNGYASLNDEYSDLNGAYAVGEMKSVVVSDADPTGYIASNTSVASDAETKDSYPPEIVFRGLLRDMGTDSGIVMTGRQKDNRFLIEGQASDSGGIEGILINGRPVVESLAGKEIFFNRLVELVEGENVFSIEATDSVGNSVTKKVRVNRKIQKIDMNESRISLSIMPFKNECISPALAESVYNLFVDRVINDGRFNVVGRGEGLEAIMRELQLSQTDLVDKEKAVRAGRLVGSETIMFGKIIETPDSVELFVYLTDTETSRIMASHDVYDQRKGRNELEFLMQGLSSKFIYSVPLIEGKVLKAKGDKFFLDLGKTKHVNLQEGLKCIAYRSEPFVVDGMVLGEDITVLGTLVLKNVQEKISIASLVEGEVGMGDENLSIVDKDLVITK